MFLDSPFESIVYTGTCTKLHLLPLPLHLTANIKWHLSNYTIHVCTMAFDNFKRFFKYFKDWNACSWKDHFPWPYLANKDKIFLYFLLKKLIRKYSYFKFYFCFYIQNIWNWETLHFCFQNKKMEIKKIVSIFLFPSSQVLQFCIQNNYNGNKKTE